MRVNGFRILLSGIAAGALLFTAMVTAQDREASETGRTEVAHSAETELPEAVAGLVNAMSGVQRVEPLENGVFAVNRRIQVTGSRLKQSVTMQVAEDGSVVDWGRRPLFTRNYTRSELMKTGEVDLGEALDQIDPSIQNSGGR